MRSFAWTMLCTPPLTPLIVRRTAYDFHPWVRQHARHPRHVKRHLGPGPDVLRNRPRPFLPWSLPHNVWIRRVTFVRILWPRWGRVELVFQPALAFCMLVDVKREATIFGTPRPDCARPLNVTPASHVRSVRPPALPTAIWGAADCCMRLACSTAVASATHFEAHAPNHGTISGIPCVLFGMAPRVQLVRCIPKLQWRMSSLSEAPAAKLLPVLRCIICVFAVFSLCHVQEGCGVVKLALYITQHIIRSWIRRA